MLGLLRWNLYHCREKVKETAYIALVRPKLEYCESVWDPSVQNSYYYYYYYIHLLRAIVIRHV